MQVDAFVRANPSLDIRETHPELVFQRLNGGEPLQSKKSEAGILLRRLQRGERIRLPQARPMPSIAPRCVELRVQDHEHTWRIVCRVDRDAVIIAEVFSKKSQKTPQRVIDNCRRRLQLYDRLVGGSDG
jgi:phage-related protein